MSTFVDYDSMKHRGLPLFERVIDGDGNIYYEPVVVSEEVAALTPWYYVVEVEV